MDFNLARSLEILERTPKVLDTLLRGLSPEWTQSSEAEGSWSPFDVMGHLVHGEQNDWPERLRITMGKTEDNKYRAFDREAQFRESQEKTIYQLLDEFLSAREENLKLIYSLEINDSDLDRTAIHPVFGSVTLRQLLATWTAHDLAHTLQITRVMARQYRDAVGPWAANLSVMKY